MILDNNSPYDPYDAAVKRSEDANKKAELEKLKTKCQKTKIIIEKPKEDLESKVSDGDYKLIQTLEEANYYIYAVFKQDNELITGSLDHKTRIYRLKGDKYFF